MLADPDLPRHFLGPAARFHLFQRRHDLRFRVIALRHLSPPQNRIKSYSSSCRFRGAGQMHRHCQPGLLLYELGHEVLIADRCP